MSKVIVFVCFVAAGLLVLALAWVMITPVDEGSTTSTRSVRVTPTRPSVVIPPATKTTVKTKIVEKEGRTETFTVTEPAEPLEFPDCASVYYSGAHHIPSGTPFYREDLDSDGDGIACENPPFEAGPTETVTETSVAPGFPIDQPPVTETVTETITAPASTTTITETTAAPASTITKTAPPSTTTITVTPEPPVVDPSEEEDVPSAPAGS